MESLRSLSKSNAIEIIILFFYGLLEPLKAVKKVLKKKQNQPQMCERSENKVPRTKVAIAIETNAFYWNIKEVSMCLNKSQTKKKKMKKIKKKCVVWIDKRLNTGLCMCVCDLNCALNILLFAIQMLK